MPRQPEITQNTPTVEPPADIDNPVGVFFFFFVFIVVVVVVGIVIPVGFMPFELQREAVLALLDENWLRPPGNGCWPSDSPVSKADFLDQSSPSRIPGQHQTNCVFTCLVLLYFPCSSVDLINTPNAVPTPVSAAVSSGLWMAWRDGRGTLAWIQPGACHGQAVLVHHSPRMKVAGNTTGKHPEYRDIGSWFGEKQPCTVAVCSAIHLRGLPRHPRSWRLLDSCKPQATQYNESHSSSALPISMNRSVGPVTN